MRSSTGRAADLKVVWDQSAADAYRRAALIPEAEFTFSVLEPLLHKTLEENRDKRFIQLQLSPDEQQLHPYPRSSHLRFDGWLYDYRLLARVHWRLVELVSIGGKAVVRIRDGNAVSKILPWGDADPLERRIGETNFEILHVDFGRNYETRGIHVFARSRTATVSDVWFFLKELPAFLHPRVTSVSVSRDGLFPRDDRFPIYYLFEIRPEPTRTEWSASDSITCSNDGQGIRCY